MIRCPSCGTFNHDSQRVCRSCGSALPQTRRRCPECGALNPVGNLFCDRCNARLLGAEDIVPGSASAQKGTGDTPQDDHTPVKGISLPTRASTPVHTTGTEDDAGQRPALPDWLAGLVDEDTELGLTEPALTGSDEVDLGRAREEGALPHWLTGGEALTPAPLLDATDAAPLPAWLAGGAEDAAALGGAAGEAEPLPDWLSDVLGSDAAEDEGISAARKRAAAAPKREAAAQENAASFDAGTHRREDAPPDRLSDGPSSEALVFAESELPNWLAQAQALTLDDLGQGDAPPDEVPVEAPHAEEEPVASSGAAEEEDIVLPDWLQEIVAEGATAAEDVGSEQLPDWLVELSSAQAAPPAVGATEVFLPSEEGSAPASAPAKETPSWLDGLDAAPEQASSPVHTTAAVFVGQPPAEEHARQNAKADALPALVEGPEQVPEWLRELDLEVSESVPTSEPALGLGDLARAEVPAWLQELAPPGTLEDRAVEPAVTSADTLAPADIPEWVEALRPERPEGRRGARVEGAPPLARAIPPTPAEPEGPLEGLVGVLPAVSAVDRPVDAKSAVVRAVPEAISAQAQLWQRLLEQPRRSERSVWRGRPSDRKGSSVFRWVVSSLLVVGLFAAFWLIPDGVRLAQVSPTQIGGGVPALVEGIDRLEPGDAVILAIEYSPAYADEMSRIAAPILAHLKSRQVEVSVVSSLPEGLGLGYALPLPVHTTGGDGYLPGGASGIAAFLAREEAASADRLVVLVSEPQRLIWWLEQNALLGADALPLSIATSASAGPLVAPYFENAQVEGWVTGLPQAFTYGEIRGDGSGGDLARVLDLLMLAHWAVVGLLLVAFFYTLVDAGTHHRRKGAS